MKIQIPAIELPAPTLDTSFRLPPAMPGSAPSLTPNPPHIIDPSKPPAVPSPNPPEPEPVVLQLKDSKFVRLTSKEVKNQNLPPYLQLELDLNPLKEGEIISADRDSSIRHAGRP